MQIGPYRIDPPVVLAPMAGVTDKPFRLLCKRLGAGLAVSEMTTADPSLWHTRKSLRRMDHEGEPEPVSVQIAGYDPAMLAEAARFNASHGAQIIDINMGCPAKKVCDVWSGSALLQDEPLVARICRAVVDAVDVPVTLKIRTGWDREHRNALNIARVAQDSGIAALAVHGRTRADKYEGFAEYDTIAAVKASVAIPVIANGDIGSPAKARFVLDYTKCDAVMIGRPAQGRPWIFREIAHYLASGELLPEPGVHEVRDILLGHLHALYAFYGEAMGVRIARKHLGWYLKSIEKCGHGALGQGRQPSSAQGSASELSSRAEDAAFRSVVNRAETTSEQLRLTAEYFDALEAGAETEFAAAA
ncbi:MAG: tRNA dihydrouridine synthase DusB [Rhodanobacteraceae bacterium]